MAVLAALPWAARAQDANDAATPPDADAPDASSDPRVDAGAADDGGSPSERAAGGAVGPGDGAGPVPERPGPAAPPPQVTVRTVEKGTRKPIAGATITVDGVAAGDTDSEGRLIISAGVGPHQLEVQVTGYTAFQQRIDLAAADTVVAASTMTELTLRLIPDVSGERFESEVRVARIEKQRRSFSVDEARRTAGTSGDPVRVLASLPGVSQVVWPAALFVVRGSNPGNTGFFIDGIRVPATFHLALGPSILNPSLVGALDFYPGAYPETFGRYIAGIVSIQTAPPPTDRVHLSADVTFYDAQALASVPIHDGRGVFTAAARYSFTGPLLSLFDPDTNLRYGDYQLRLDHLLGSGRVTFFAFGSLDQLDSTVRGPTTKSIPTIQTAALQFHRIDLRWLGAVAGGRLTAGITTGYDAARSTLTQALLSVEALELAPRAMWTRPLGRAWDFELGADAELQRFKTHPLPLTETLGDLARSRSALSQGSFVALRLHPGDRLLVTPGLRADLFAEEGTTRFVLQPRLDARLVLLPSLSLRGNLGRFSQMPSLPINVAGFESFGLASLGLQRSDSASLGFDARLPGDTAFEVTGFYQRMKVTDLQKIDLPSTRITSADSLVLDDGVSYGVETILRRPARHRLNGWLAYTLSYSLRNGASGIVRSDWDQRHILNLVTGYRIGGGFSAGARVHYNTGRNAPYGRLGQYREIPPYAQLDLRAERRMLFDSFILDVFIDVANATYNRELVQYAVANNGEAKPSYLHVFLPTVGVHGQF